MARTFKDYVEDRSPRLRSEWLFESSRLEIYARKSLRWQGCFVLANVRLPEELQKQGILTRFLAQWSNLPLVFENTHNPYLRSFLVRNGWTELDLYGEDLILNDHAHELYEASKVRKP